MTNHPIQTTSFVPIYHWRGARPQLVDLEPDQTGWLTCLCLHRQGDLCLLPLAWQVDALDEHDTPTTTPHPHTTIYTTALDAAAVSQTLQQLQQESWQISGQLTLTYTGRDTTANFEQTYSQYLWQTPQS